MANIIARLFDFVAGTRAKSQDIDDELNNIINNGVNPLVTEFNTHKDDTILAHPDQSVTTAKIKDANVTTVKIADANVTNAKLADNAVTTTKITDANVTTSKIADSSITTSKIADSNVTTSKLANSSVTNTKIANGAITTEKIDPAIQQDVGNGVFDARLKELESPKYSEALTQFSSVFKQGSGKNPSNADIDVSSSVVDGKISATVKGQTLTNVANNGDNYSNWVNVGLATFNSEGITFTGDNGVSNAQADLSTLSLKPSTQYTLILVVSKCEVVSQNTPRIIGGAGYILDVNDVMSYDVGINKLLITTKATLTSTDKLRLLLGNTSFTGTEQVTFKVMLLEGDYTNQEVNYIDGIKSTNQVRVKSVGKNLFDKNKVGKGEFIVLSSGALSANADYAYIWVKVKPNTQYKLSHYLATNTAWFRNKGTPYIEKYSVIDTSPSGANYLGITIALTDLDVCMLEYGSTASTYEEYEESPVYYTKTSRSLPNGVKDETNDSGEFIQRVSEYVLQSGDITALNTTKINYDYIYINRSSLPSVFAQQGGSTPKRHIIPNYVVNEEYSTGVFTDSASYIGTYIDSLSASTSIILFVAKGTYADLPAAQIALAGTKVIYQLETPITTQLSLPDLNSFPNGSVIVDQVIKERLQYNATTGNGIDISDTNYKIDSLESVYKIEYVSGQEVKTPIDLSNVTIAVGGLSFTITGASDGQTYEFIYAYPSELGTLPEFEGIYPLNTNATIQDNNAMILASNKEITNIWDTLIAIAEKEILMYSIADITTDMSLDANDNELKSKLNEILAVWK